MAAGARIEVLGVVRRMSGRILAAGPRLPHEEQSTDETTGGSLQMKTFLAAAAAVSLALLPLAADAHGPTRKKITESVEINAPAEKV